MKARKGLDGKAFYRRLPNINLLPEEMRSRLLGRVGFFLVAVAVAELFILLAVGQSLGDLREKAARTRQQAAPLRASLAQVKASQPEVQKLLAEIAGLSHGSKDLSRLPRFSPLPWAFVNQSFSGAEDRKVILASLSQTSSGATVSGDGASSSGVLEYVRFLKELPMVASVTLQSLNRRTVTVEKRETVEVEKLVPKDIFNTITGEFIAQILVTEKVTEERVVTETMDRYQFSLAVRFK